MYCHKCGKEIPDDADYCPYCGSEVIYKPKTQPKRIEDEEGYISFGVDEKGDPLRTDPLNQKSVGNKVEASSSATSSYKDKKWSITVLAIFLALTIVLVFTPIFEGYGSILSDIYLDDADWMFFLFAIIFIDIAFYMVGYLLVCFLNPEELRSSQKERNTNRYKIGTTAAASIILIIGIIFLVLAVGGEDLSSYGVADVILTFVLGIVYIVVVLFEQCNITSRHRK
ncbi:MAG: zinc ribbon domain-containing protein [Coprobacillus sp.]|nr:zinc ribbon domain-containing protein [Coprobacillus sp.]